MREGGESVVEFLTRLSHYHASSDVNLELAGLLLDLAFLAGKSERAWGFKRAAKAVLRIDRAITPLVDANTFRAISGIGPTTDRIARELIHDDALNAANKGRFRLFKGRGEYPRRRHDRYGAR